MKPLRITILHGGFLPVPPIWGGAVEKVWFSLAKEFARLGHDVTQISRQMPGWASDETIGGVLHRRVRGYLNPDTFLELFLREFLFCLRVLPHLPPADVIVTNSFWAPVLIRHPRFGRLYIHVARFPKGQMRFYRHAARLQAISSPVATAIHREDPRLIDITRIIPYPHGQEEFQQSAPFSSRSQTLLFVGRLHPEKGIEELVQGFVQAESLHHKGWRLKLVGPWQTHQGGGGETFFRNLQALATSRPGLVTFEEPIFSPEKLALEYQTATAFVYPSKALTGEAFGLAPLEAMANGCPPIVSDLACFQDFVKNGENGLILNEITGPAIAGFLASKLVLSPFLAGLSEGALKTAQRFSLPGITREFLEDFYSLVNARS